MSESAAVASFETLGIESTKAEIIKDAGDLDLILAFLIKSEKLPEVRKEVLGKVLLAETEKHLGQFQAALESDEGIEFLTSRGDSIGYTTNPESVVCARLDLPGLICLYNLGNNCLRVGYGFPEDGQPSVFIDIQTSEAMANAFKECRQFISKSE